MCSSIRLQKNATINIWFLKKIHLTRKENWIEFIFYELNLNPDYVLLWKQTDFRIRS